MNHYVYTISEDSSIAQREEEMMLNEEYLKNKY